jgi:hypothetical protein
MCKLPRNKPTKQRLQSILQKINEWVKSIAEALLEEEQSGFRKGRSCNDNIFILKEW